MRIKLIPGLLILLSLACQGTRSTVEPTEAPAASPSPAATPTSTAIPPTAVPTEVPIINLAPLAVDANASFANTSLVHAQSDSFAGQEVRLPFNLAQLANPEVIEGLTSAQTAHLRRNGFTIMHSQEGQFYHIRESVSRSNGQPYFLTTDAALHALHLTFDDLLKALEREQFRPRMMALLQATQQEILQSISGLQGTAIQADTELAAAYLAVAVRLFDPDTVVETPLADQVEAQLEQIMAAGGKDFSALFPEFEDDYGAYKPVGHYAGDPDLEHYFRGMTWLGRVHFALENETSSRLPLIVTLALRRAQAGGQPAVDDWRIIHESLTFLIGPSDDGGPVEYAALMDEIYGISPTLFDLADEDLWRAFVAEKDRIPAPQINSTFVDFIADLESEAGWRFMGQRFTLDAFIFQNLMFDKVQPRDGERRLLPTGLDVMAALGSPSAAELLEELGETTYPLYPEQMAFLQEIVQTRPEATWLGRAYESWLYTFLPILAPKDTDFPSFMRTDAWCLKDMNTALGSWAELKHDTILYSKMAEAAGGGGPPCTSGAAPGYVEPVPEAFHRMAYLARTIAAGLRERDLAAPADFVGFAEVTTLDGLVFGMGELGDQFEVLAGIAEKELQGLPLEESDFITIQACLGTTECALRSYGSLLSDQDADVPPPPIVAAVAGAGDGDAVLEVATGYVDRIYVIVPINGRLMAAQGGVYSYYEFTQPRSERLTDEEWRERLNSPNPPAQPGWASELSLPGGQPNDVMAFHIRGAYVITEEGADLNLRESPSLTGEVLRQLQLNEFVQIVAGPVEADGFTWWQFNICGTEVTGWAVEEPAWYERYR